MPGLFLYRSNRLEYLADGLGRLLSTPLINPLQAEIVVVQSIGMRRWLSLELAQRLGVAMNFQFPFPAALLERVFSAALGPAPGAGQFERAILPWRILDRLPGLLPKPAFEELRDYVQGGNQPLKEFQLAQRIATVFDRCLAWRPRLILDWEQGREASWRAELWRALSPRQQPKAAAKRGAQLEFALLDETGRTAGPHLPARAAAFVEWLKTNQSGLNMLPERLSIFGVGSLPPAYTELLAALAKVINVHFFLLTPTPEFWSDLRSPKEVRRALRRQKGTMSADDLHLEVGNSLLGSLGRIGREFAEIVADLEPTQEEDATVPPLEDSLLHRMQADIFHLREPAAGATTPLPPTDCSLQVHCCHGPMREVEVLHDQLLQLFAADPTLEPRDVLITMPDLEGYAPYVDAVFSAPEEEKLRLPFSIADRSLRTESGLGDAFLSLLDLPAGRCGVPCMLGLLETPSLRARFQIRESDTPLLQAWIEQSGIRWGLDAEHRAAHGFPGFAENTWRTGLDRLLLGYALPGDGQSLYAGLLPLAEVEGDAAQILGNLADYVQAVAWLRPMLANAKSLREWEAVLLEVLARFFKEEDDSADDLRRLRRIIQELSRLAGAAQFEAPIEFAVLRAHLATALEDTDASGGFLAGALTFCALKPMRSIPFRVVCMLGMNDGAFPRHEAPLAFDPLAQKRERGDRSLRDDDRYLFLETLLSARDTLYLSYTGRSARDNAELPPAAVVGELLEAVARHVPVAGVVTLHRLQAFSPAYFSPSGPLFSYSGTNHAAAVSSLQPRQPPPVLGAEMLPSPAVEGGELDVDDFIRFFTDPAGAFGRQRLGMQLPWDDGAMDEREPMERDSLNDYALRCHLWEQVRSGRTPEESLEFLRAAGLLAPGLVGAAWHAELREEVEAFYQQAKPVLNEAKLPPLSVDLRVDAWHLTGALDEISVGGLVRLRPARINAKDRLRAWVAHVILNAAAPSHFPRTTRMLGQDGRREFAPLKAPGQVLAALLRLYAAGQQKALRFFPETSLALLEAPDEDGAQTLGHQKAWHQWESVPGGKPGEGTKAWTRYLYHNLDDPLDEAWAQIARDVYEPMLAHQSAEAGAPSSAS